MASPLRRFLIELSKNAQMQDVIVGIPASRQMARRFVAGETLDDAIAAIRTTNANRMLATLDFLGEHVDTEAEASVNADEYIRALQAIARAGVNSNVSIKLTAMGLAIDDDFCYRNVRRIVQQAAELGNFVRIDMEDTPVTDRTLAIYRRLRAEFPNCGVVIQAYLYRSESDIRSLMDQGMAHLRLCKGAYDEPPEVAYQEKKDVDANMVRLIQLMLDNLDAFPGTYPAVASHDHMVINWVKAYAYHHQISTDASSSRCSTASAATSSRRSPIRATKCGCTSPTARAGIPILCAAWPSGRQTWSFSCAPWWAGDQGETMSDRTERLRAELTDARSYLVSVAEQIGPEQALNSTENPLWNVHDLLGHLAGAERGMQATVKRFPGRRAAARGLFSRLLEPTPGREAKGAQCARSAGRPGRQPR